MLDTMTMISRQQREEVMKVKRQQRQDALKVLKRFVEGRRPDWSQEDHDSVIGALGLDQEPFLVTLILGENEQTLDSYEAPGLPMLEPELGPKAPPRRPRRVKQDPLRGDDTTTDL